MNLNKPRLFNSFDDLLRHGRELLFLGETETKHPRLDTHINEHSMKNQALFLLINRFMFTTYSTDAHDIHESICGILPLSTVRATRLLYPGFFHLVFNPLTKHVYAHALPFEEHVPPLEYSQLSLPVDNMDGMPENFKQAQSLVVEQLNGCCTTITFGYHLATVSLNPNNTINIPQDEQYKLALPEVSVISSTLFMNPVDPLVVCFLEDKLACRTILYTHIANELSQDGSCIQRHSS